MEELHVRAERPASGDGQPLTNNPTSSLPDRL
jgi:hypothetical protein